MSQPDMYEMIFMTDKGDEETIWRLFPDGIEAAYWADDTARSLQWSLIDVIQHEEKEVLSE
tara:strand:- start:319 stop:501 length:183 start_codon:yes stop_codon:yes gene_type:complete